MFRSLLGRLVILGCILTVVLSAMAPRAAGAPAKAPAWQPVGDATSGFSRAVMRWDHAAAKRHLADALRKHAERVTVHRLMGIEATPHRYWYWIDRFDGQRAQVSLTHYFPDGRQPVTNRLQWTKVGSNWRIAGIARVAVSAPAGKGVGVAATGLGYAVLHGNRSTINSYATPALLKRAPAGHLINLMGMQNLPGSFRYTVDSSGANSATVTMKWAFGRSTVVDRLDWVKTVAGWRVSAVKVLAS